MIEGLMLALRDRIADEVVGANARLADVPRGAGMAPPPMRFRSQIDSGGSARSQVDRSEVKDGPLLDLRIGADAVLAASLGDSDNRDSVTLVADYCSQRPETQRAFVEALQSLRAVRATVARWFDGPFDGGLELTAEGLSVSRPSMRLAIPSATEGDQYVVMQLYMTFPVLDVWALG